MNSCCIIDSRIGNYFSNSTGAMFELFIFYLICNLLSNYKIITSLCMLIGNFLQYIYNLEQQYTLFQCLLFFTYLNSKHSEYLQISLGQNLLLVLACN